MDYALIIFVLTGWCHMFGYSTSCLFIAKTTTYGKEKA